VLINKKSLDLNCYNDNNVFYACVNGIKYKLFYFTDFNSTESLIYAV